MFAAPESAYWEAGRFMSCSVMKEQGLNLCGLPGVSPAGIPVVPQPDWAGLPG